MTFVNSSTGVARLQLDSTSVTVPGGEIEVDAYDSVMDLIISENTHDGETNVVERDKN